MSYTPQWGPGQSGQSQQGGGVYGQPQSGGYGQYDSGGYGSGGYGSGGGGFGNYGPPNQPPNQFGNFGPPPGPPSPPPRRPRRFGGLIRFLVLIVIVGGLAVAYPTLIRPALAKFGNDAAQEAEEEANSGARTAQAGECVVDKNAPGQASAAANNDDAKLRVVPCDSPEAAFKVVGVVENKTQVQADASDVCSAYPDTDFVYWEGYVGRTGLVLCLQDLKAKK
jgi:hypothetical protein